MRQTITVPASHFTSTPDDTERLGRAIGSRLGAGNTVALYGELGSGKTVFVKGLAAGLGVAETITSPTFIIVGYHRGQLDLFHIDAYRLEPATEDTVLQIGLPEMLAGEGVCAIEWAELVAAWLPPQRLDVHLSHEAAGRRIVLVPHGERFERLVEELNHDALARA